MSSLGDLPCELILEIAGHFTCASELLPLTNVTNSLRNLLHPLLYTSARKEAGVLTLVQKAIMLECPYFLQYVLDQGNDVNNPGYINTLPILMAISSGRFCLVEVLLKAELTEISVGHWGGGGVVHYVLRNYKLADRLSSLGMLSLILSDPCFLRKDLDALDSSNLTPLSISAGIGDVGIMKLLVQYGARYDGWRGVHALHLCVKGGHEDALHYLLELGIDVNGTLEAQTALFSAVHNSRLGMVSLLLSCGAKQSISLRTSYSIPAVAIRKQNLLVLAALLPFAVQEPTAVRFEYIRAALGQESSQLLSMLLRVPGFNLGEVDESTGDTILHNVVICSKPLPWVAYERLIRYGSDKFQQHPRLGGTPINWAIRKQNMDALRAMLKKGENLNFKDEVTGATIVHDAVDTGIVEILKIVLDAGASPHIINLRTGRFPVHHAVERGNFEMTSLLVRKGTGCNLKEAMTGNTPLHIAVMNGHDFLVDFLISRGAYPRARNFMGETPRTLAAMAEPEGSAYASEARVKIRQMLANC
ncbi:ankyrin repeat-containing domain protein [Tuber borchii]|uniref:Ankyrin repeat-containing domain protein n=1 Tax=Tuber borchii TaxID=42251 RepID=A0A2T6ZSC9_TUBBO|nr:ankyrin repeat-containing domain protein [Tuber borchii]